MRRLQILTGCVIAASFALDGTTAHAAFHLWQVKEVFSNSDGTVQFVELFDSNAGEQFVGGKLLRANSDGVIKDFPIPSNLVVIPPNTTAGKHMLIATPGFAALTGGVTPDYTLSAAVLMNGPFFNPNATNITFTFSGSNDSVSFAGTLLPKDGVNSLTDANAFGAVPNNPTNIGVTVNSPTDFGGTAGSVNVPPPPTGDYNGNHVVDAADYTKWRDTLGLAASPNGSGADGNANGMIDDGDYDYWKMRFGNPAPGAGAGSGGAVDASGVPEPASLVLVTSGLLTWWTVVISLQAARKMRVA